MFRRRRNGRAQSAAGAHQGLSRGRRFRDDGTPPLDDLMPGLGPDVVGASYCADDGHCNALYLLRALHADSWRWAGAISTKPGRPVSARGERLHHRRRRAPNRGRTGDPRRRSRQCPPGANGRPQGSDHSEPGTGPGHRAAAPDHDLPRTLSARPRRVRHDRRFHEDVGFDDGTTAGVMATSRVTRSACSPSWRGCASSASGGAFGHGRRTGFPIYDRSPSHAGAFALSCHSGVSLAAVHATRLVAWICDDDGAPSLEDFSADRFDVEKAA